MNNRKTPEKVNVANVRRAIDIAETKLGIPDLMDAQDIVRYTRDAETALKAYLLGSSSNSYALLILHVLSCRNTHGNE